MEKILNKVNGFIPTLTAFAVVLGFLFYMVALFFIKGLDIGYGVTILVGSQQELVANGFLIAFGLLGQITIKAFCLTLENWPILIFGSVIAACMLLIDFLLKKKPSEGISVKFQKHFGYLIFFLIIIYVFIIFPTAAYEKGKKVAQDEITLLNEKGCTVKSKVWRKCSYISYKNLDKLVKLEGLLLDKTGQEITVYLPKEKVLRTFLLPSDAIIERNFVSD